MSEIKPTAPQQLTSLTEAGLVTRDEWQASTTSRRMIGTSALSNIQEPLVIQNLDNEDLVQAALKSLIQQESGEYYEAAGKAVDEISKTVFDYEKKADFYTGNPFLDESYADAPVFFEPTLIDLTDPHVQELIGSRDTTQAHADLLAAWPKFLETFNKGVDRGITSGYIPTGVKLNMQDGLTKTGVRIVDSIVMVAVGGSSLGAYYDSDKDEVGVRHDSKEPEIMNSLVHEFVHKISGGTFLPPNALVADHFRQRVGFSTELYKGLLNRTGFNEAVTHHITLGITTGDFETLDPNKRTDGDTTYNEYRKILATFVDRSGGVVDVKTLTNSFFEDAGPEGGLKARKKLMKEVKKAYGSRALHKLEDLMTLTNIVNADRMDEIILSRIHPPELDEHGAVIKRGIIDNNNLPTLFDLYIN